MSDSGWRQTPPFESGESLFIFEPDHVRVLGQDGSEAAVPRADFEAFVEFLAQRFLAEPAGRPDHTPEDGEL